MVESARAEGSAASVAGAGGRPEQPEPFLRGAAFPPGPGVPYPRAKADDLLRLPADTWHMASIPVGVRLELVGDAEEIEISYRTATGDLGYRGRGAGTTFALWSDGDLVAEQEAEHGEGVVRLPLPPGEDRAIVYLPEGMRPTVHEVTGVGGDIEPAAPQPRWVAYGDSVAEGWIASGPALAWPAIAGRDQGLDVANLGYAGAARGEVVSAEHVASLEADVISITHGTNCWTRIPHSVGLFREGLIAFLDIVRASHRETPILVASPIVRPDAEETPNVLGATLADLRAVMEETVRERIDAGDAHLELIEGLPIVPTEQLGDGIHPDDDGHRALAAAIGPRVRALVT